MLLNLDSCDKPYIGGSLMNLLSTIYIYTYFAGYSNMVRCEIFFRSVYKNDAVSVHLVHDALSILQILLRYYKTWIQ